MLWISLGLLLVLALFGYLRWKRMAPLFADVALAEVAAALPELKRRALAAEGAEGTTPADPPSVQTALLALAYSIAREGETWVHHVSVSNKVTSARAAGAFFLGLVRGLLGLDGAPFTAFVSQRLVFHLVVRLSDDEQRAFAAHELPPKTAEALRGLAITGRTAIFPRLGTGEVPLPPRRA